MKNLTAIRKFIVGLLLGASLSSGVVWLNVADAGLRAIATNPNTYVAGGTDVAVADGGTGASTAQAAAANLGVPYVIAKSAIPFVKLSSGSIGNNGALSGITALQKAYAGAYVYVPAGGIAAGVPAAATWYWAVFSTTQAATIYNSIYTTGVPTAGVTTAFATTGPGAFTGATGAVTAQNYAMAGGSMGANGALRMNDQSTGTSNANAKTVTLQFGATAVSPAFSLASNSSMVTQVAVRNRGAQNDQICTINNAAIFGTGISNSATLFTGIDTSASVTVTRTLNAATATDNVVLEAFEDTVIFGQ